MEVKIGVQHATRELTVNTDESQADITKALSEALTTPGALFTLSDTKGRAVSIPADKLAYVEFGSDTSHPVGFGV